MMTLVDARYKKSYYYDVHVAQCPEEIIKYGSIGSLHHLISENRSLLINVSFQEKSLRKLLHCEKRNICCFSIIKKIFNIMTCYLFSPIKQANKGIVQLREKKAVLRANISTIQSEIQFRQKQEINKWWNDNLAVVSACFVEKSINRFKVLVFEILNQQYNSKNPKPLRLQKRLADNLTNLSISLISLEAKIKFSSTLEDKSFIELLIKKPIDSTSAEAFLSENLWYKKDKGRFVIDTPASNLALP